MMNVQEGNESRHTLYLLKEFYSRYLEQNKRGGIKQMKGCSQSHIGNGTNYKGPFLMCEETMFF